MWQEKKNNKKKVAKLSIFRFRWSLPNSAKGERKCYNATINYTEFPHKCHSLMRFPWLPSLLSTILFSKDNEKKLFFTFTGEAVILIFPQDTASSGLAPESLPSNSWPVLTNTEKSAPLRWIRKPNCHIILSNKRRYLTSLADPNSRLNT